MQKNFTLVSDELIRVGAHDDCLGSDGFQVIVYLLSRATSTGNQRPWETSAAQMAEQFGWPQNRRRITKAIEAAVKDGRLLIRQYVRNGDVVRRRCAYVVAAGGRRFTDEEATRYSAPICLSSRLAQ